MSASRLTHQRRETVGGALLVSRHDVPVDGQRDGDTGVAQPLAHGLDRLTVGQQQGGVRVPQIVDGDLGRRTITEGLGALPLC